MDSLEECLKSGKASCKDISANEVAHVKSWHTFSKAFAGGADAMPATALLAALHNMVTETVSDAYDPAKRKHSYCPKYVLDSLKAGIFAGNKTVASYTLPMYAPLAHVPGLSKHHSSVSCN